MNCGGGGGGGGGGGIKLLGSGRVYRVHRSVQCQKVVSIDHEI